MRGSFLIALTTLAAPVLAQYSDDFESLTASAAGAIITGQNGYYLPAVAGSIDGLVFTYAGNNLGVPVNPNGGNHFYAGVSQAGNMFTRAQRSIAVPAGLVYVQFDVCCNYAGAGTPTNNIGSFSFQPSSSSVGVNALARWPAVQTVPPTWDADAVVGTAQQAIGHPAFLGLDVNVWHTWGVTADLAAGEYVDFRITNGTTGTTTVFVPPTPMSLPNAGLAHPTDFRFFTGGADNVFATDNLIIETPGTRTIVGKSCGLLDVPILACTQVPSTGGSLDMQLTGVPSGGLGTVLANVGPTSPGIPLPSPPFAAGCEAYIPTNAPSLGVVFLANPLTPYPFSIPIPSQSTWLGLTLSCQGAALDVANGEALTTNALDAVTGGVGLAPTESFCTADRPYDPQALPLVWPIGNQTLTWSGAPNGAFTLMQGGSTTHSGTLTLDLTTAGPYGMTLIETISQGAQTLNISTTATITNPPTGTAVSVAGTMQGLPFSYDYDLLNQQVSNIVIDPGIPAVSAQFNLAAFMPYAQEVQASATPLSGMILQMRFAACAAAPSCSYWKCMAKCAFAGAVTGAGIATGGVLLGAAAVIDYQYIKDCL